MASKLVGPRIQCVCLRDFVTSARGTSPASQPVLPAFQPPRFGFDSDPHGSKSGSEGIPWQLFSSRISWQPPNPAMMSKMDRNIKGFGSGFSDFSDFPQMENRGLRWIALGLGSPKTLFSAKKSKFLGHFWPFPIIWGFPLGPLLAPIGPYWPTWGRRQWRSL